MYRFIKIRLLLITILTIGIQHISSAQDNTPDKNLKDYAQYVNPFIGTQGDGHCFPGATSPLGIVQPGPESTTDHYPGYEGRHVAGYQYDDPYIWGFTQTHLNGAGCPTLSDILLLPFYGNANHMQKRSDFRSRYDKKSETASPGYYGVELIDHKVKAEMTALPHIAYHRYTYAHPDSAKLLIDLQYGVSWDINNIKDNILAAEEQFTDSYTLYGYRKAREWTERKLFYVIKWNKPLNKYEKLTPPDNAEEKAPRYIISFDMGNDPCLEVCVAVSTVSIDEAYNNLNTEFKGWKTFDTVCQDTRNKWNKIFNLIEFEGSEEQKVNFYTSFYHLYTQPNNIADVSGTYRACNDSTYTSPDGKHYSTLSMWDTFRAANPLYSIITPSLSEELVTTMMSYYIHKPTDPNNPSEANPYFPRWGLWGREVHTMIANHSVPVIVDAWLKGIKSPYFNDEELFDALWTTVTKPHYRNHVELIDRYGYIPYDAKISSIDDGRETVSRLLEGIYDDYCVAQMAKALGKTDKYEFLSKRAAYYRNVYDTESGFMRGKDKNGQFKTDVDITEVVGEWIPESDFTEGNSFHYRFHVQHDIPGLIELNGGKDQFANRLDSMFLSKTNPVVKNKTWKALGSLGQYWHGNEPCHHLIYLYKYTDRGYMTDLLLRYLTDNFYRNAPNGLRGNDDCGQMSAWYMLACAGFYPVNPCGGEYILGAPQAGHIVFNLPNGKKFEIIADNFSDKNYEVAEVQLNGVKLDRNYITHEELAQGGTLRFKMKRGRTSLDKVPFAIQ